MATQTGTIKFQGKLGNVVGYYRNGKYCLRTRPEHVRQTAATKNAALAFGMISRKGKLIRRSITPYLSLRYDGSMMNRLNRELVKAARPSQHADISHLKGFRFNQHTGLDRMLTQPPVFSSKGTVQLPAQEFCKTGNATHLEVRAISVRINFAHRNIVATDVSAAVIELDQPFNGLELLTEAPGHGTLFVVLQVRACITHNGKLLPSGDRRYTAADIIAVVPPAHQLRGRNKAAKAPAHRSAFSQHQHQSPQSPGAQFQAPGNIPAAQGLNNTPAASINRALPANPDGRLE